MKIIARFIFLILFIPMLTSCAGKLVRPEPDSLVNGKTTYGQAIGKLGKPDQEETIIKNEFSLKAISYSRILQLEYCHREGKTPVQVLILFFYNDTLVANIYSSSIKNEHTDYDESLRHKLVKGKTTKSEVVQLLGKPSGSAIYPAVKSKGKESYLYFYSDIIKLMNIYGRTYPKKLSKDLTIVFDEAGHVDEIEYLSNLEHTPK